MTDSRTRILDAAAALVAEDAARLTVDRVAERAGVSRATAFRRFGSKEGLIEALERERGIDVTVTGDTRSRILEAAASEFRRSGVHGASISAIADRAGVNPQSVYNHFGDKEALLVALFADDGQDDLVAMASAATPTSLEQVIRDFVRGAVALSGGRNDLLGALLVPDPLTKRAFARGTARANEAERHLVAALREMDLPEGVSAEFAASSLMGLIMLHSTLQPALTGKEPEDRDALADAITTLFVRGLGVADGD